MRLRYHQDIGLPDNVPLRPPTDKLRYSAHALTAALHEQERITLPTLIHPLAQTVELSVNQDGTPWRWLLRQRQSGSQRDLCLVVEADGLVVTLWTNHRLDAHRTLNRALYATPARGLYDRN